MLSEPQRFRAFCANRVNHALPGADIDAIEAFERKRGVVLPPDLCEFFMLMDGSADSMSADDLAFWSLAEVRPIPEVFTGTHNPCMDLRVPKSLANFETYYVFADYLIWSYFYAVRLTPDGQQDVVFVYGEEWVRVAHSFTEFLVSYLREVESPHFCAILPQAA